MKPGPKPDSKWGSKIVEGKLLGRNNIVVPPEEVEDLAALGCTDRDIANWFGVDENTLRYNLSDHLLKGRENLKQSLRRAQIKLALSGNATMLIWLGKNILLQQENPTNSDANAPLPWTDDK